MPKRYVPQACVKLNGGGGRDCVVRYILCCLVQVLAGCSVKVTISICLMAGYFLLLSGRAVVPYTCDVIRASSRKVPAVFLLQEKWL